MYTLTIDKLDGEYQEVETLLLHSAFQIFCDFMDSEVLPDSIVDWGHDVHSSGIYLEMLYLYKWWNGRQDYTNATRGSYWPDDYMVFIDHVNKPYKSIEWDDEKYPFMSPALRASHVESERMLKQETVNLQRLMKIRRYLWT